MQCISVLDKLLYSQLSVYTWTWSGCIVHDYIPDTSTYYPVHICAAELLCVQLHQFEYVHTYVYMLTKNKLFTALPLANLLLGVICCLLFEFMCLHCSSLCPASCTDRVNHAFQIKHGGNRPQNIFF